MVLVISENRPREPEPEAGDGHFITDSIVSVEFGTIYGCINLDNISVCSVFMFSIHHSVYVYNFNILDHLYYI